MEYAPLDISPPRLARWPRDVSLVLRTCIFIEAMVTLLWLDLCGCFGFRVIRWTVSRASRGSTTVRYDALALVRVAVRDACVFYFKPVLCLQRSAAVTRMLRRRGVQATLVIGCQTSPIEGHAWVELADTVIWDYMSRLHHFRILDRV
jgi:hypothetical protein